MPGQPRITGTRLIFAFVLELLASGMSPQRIVSDYPELTLDDIHAAIAYAAWLASEQVGGTPADRP